MNTPSLGQIGIIPGPHTFVERGIAWITRSDVYHVVICVSDTDLVEAQPGGVIRAPLTKWSEAIWSDFPLTPEQAQGSADYALAHLGTPYSFAGDAAIGLSKLFHGVPNWLFRLLSKDGHVQCAQLGYDALSLGAKINVFPNQVIDTQVYPGTFETLFKSEGWWTE